jgi:hypothetical protein
MADAADPPAVVNTRFATYVRRQMRPDPRRLRVCELEMIRIHPYFSRKQRITPGRRNLPESEP